jgi:hypothetical protein
MGAGRAFRDRSAPVRRACVDRLVARARNDEPGGKDGRDLGPDSDSQTAACGTSARSAADERGERRGKRNRSEAVERGALRALTALQRRARPALAQMCSERAAFRARELAALQEIQGLLGLLTRQAALELLAEGAPGAKHQSLDRGERDVEHLGDLCVRTSFELAHDKGGALVEGEEAEGVADLGCGRDVGVFGRRRCEGIVELDLARASRRLPEALAADVVRDLDQPVVRCVRSLAALERSIGVEEGRLGDVLGVGLVLKNGERVAVDRVDVPAVEAFEGGVGGAAAGCEERGHRRLDAVPAPILRFAPRHWCGLGRAALHRARPSCSLFPTVTAM